MRNAVIIATPGTDPVELLALLGQHPEIAALPPVRLSAMLHGTSHGIVRALKPGPAEGPAVPIPLAHLDTMDLARQTSRAAVDLVFEQLRRTASADTVVVWDPQGLKYPFSDPPDIHLILLTRSPLSAAQRLAGGIHLEDISAVVEKLVHEATARPRAWGLAEERVLSVDEEALMGSDVLERLLEFLDVTSDPSAIQNLLAQHRIRSVAQGTC